MPATLKPKSLTCYCPGSELGLYNNESGKVVLNKKAELNKKLGYKLAQELLNEDYIKNNKI